MGNQIKSENEQPTEKDVARPEKTLDKCCFLLKYKPDRFTQLAEKRFYFEGGFNAAHERAKLHCEIMGYEFIHMTAMFQNLDFEEKRIKEQR